MSHRSPRNLNRNACQATIHCLTACAIGEVLGLMIATALVVEPVTRALIARGRGHARVHRVHHHDG